MFGGKPPKGGKVVASEDKPKIQVIEADAAQQQFSSVLNDVSRGEKRVVVEERGVRVAVIISPQDLDHFQELETERQNDFKIIDELRAAFRDVPGSEIESEVERALREVRQENRPDAHPES